MVKKYFMLDIVMDMQLELAEKCKVIIVLKQVYRL
jgi:hypothetical protein